VLLFHLLTDEELSSLVISTTLLEEYELLLSIGGDDLEAVKTFFGSSKS
jgi:hypothetical protein